MACIDLAGVVTPAWHALTPTVKIVSAGRNNNLIVYKREHFAQLNYVCSDTLRASRITPRCRANKIRQLMRANTYICILGLCTLTQC